MAQLGVLRVKVGRNLTRPRTVIKGMSPFALSLPKQFVIFDTEYTAWEGSQQRRWAGPGEHREVIQLAAVMVDGTTLIEQGSFCVYIKPTINPILSEFITTLTGITQAKIDEQGAPLEVALQAFKKWSKALPNYSFGRDSEVIDGNCALVGIQNPLRKTVFKNIRDLFSEHGIQQQNYNSSTIVRAFGVEPTRRAHDALDDVRTVLDALNLLKRQLEAAAEEFQHFSSDRRA